MTTSQVDKLGERLKAGNHTDDDLRLLDEYRQSFGDVYSLVIQELSRNVGVEPTGRRIKSTPSIVGKLRRQSTKLSQIQDIAGCRIIVDSIVEQNRTVDSIISVFSDHRLLDRRVQPSHGYRAVHIIVRIADKLVEIQVRTDLQHLWAQFSERLSDKLDPAIKYGEGPAKYSEFLLRTSRLVTDLELLELTFIELRRSFREELLKWIDEMAKKD